MATSVSVTGLGGIKVGSDSTPIAAQRGAPPELHFNQWGLYRFDVRPREEESS